MLAWCVRHQVSGVSRQRLAAPLGRKCAFLLDSNHTNSNVS
ncbi:hypothetical protein RRSWK_04096 [Rhodopirellula sp. SWK7]|nr:hypothetical protein RRSWK_04096 [Rhodopirellula sp. SWK7]